MAGMVAATVTPQHLLMNRNSLFKGGLQPHNYCLPVLKRETHSECLNPLFECLSYLLFGDPVSRNSCVKSWINTRLPLFQVITWSKSA